MNLVLEPEEAAPAAVARVSWRSLSPLEKTVAQRHALVDPG